MSQSASADLRLATAADVPALAALHGESAAEPWGEQDFASLLESPGVFGLVAEADTLLGLVLARSIAGEAEILTIAVAPAHRRQGIASALLEVATRIAVSRGAAALFLEVAETNRPAHTLYEMAGFTQVGKRPRYYADGADALVLRKNLAG